MSKFIKMVAAVMVGQLLYDMVNISCRRFVRHCPKHYSELELVDLSGKVLHRCVQCRRVS
jgi:hypothetical protein